MSRPFIVAANWKMNKTPGEVTAYFGEFFTRMKKTSADLILFFPPALLAQSVAENIPRKNTIAWGGQNCHFEKSGAYTGENSAETFKRMGATWNLVGHSERRNLFHESDEIVAKKLRAIQDCGLRPLLCIGESSDEREKQETQAVLKRQLSEGLKLAELGKGFAIAYEPVWAIGTGKVASATQVAEAHRYIRDVLSTMKSNLAENTPILYGGSVTPENCNELSGIDDVDGFLVGGASLKPETFMPIASISKKSIGQR